MPETTRIEYKQELTDGLEKEVIAFLNYAEGGIIYIGIDKTSKAIGLTDADGSALKIKDRLKHNIAPSCLGLFDIRVEELDGKDIIKIIVASGPEKPYHLTRYGMTPKGAFIRVGTAAEPMTQKMIDELYTRRTRHTIGRMRANKQDLRFEQLRIYYQERGIELNDQFATNLELKVGEDFNYVGYLMADNNTLSVPVATYAGMDRVDLIEKEECGHASVIKMANRVLDKIGLENKTLTKITGRERKEVRLWDEIALREAVLNAFVHNDFSREGTPKFEIFSDRMEITSFGGLPDGLSEEEFFQGYSVPRNKELMRIFKDLGFVEQLGSGVPRILQHYGRECFQFSDNFLRMTFPSVDSGDDGNQVSNQVSNQVGNQEGWDALASAVMKMLAAESYQPTEASLRKYAAEAEKLSQKDFQIIDFCQTPRKRKEILEDCLGVSNQTKNFKSSVLPLVESEFIQYTIKDKPNSQHQKYAITTKGNVALFIKEHKQA